jgi:UDP-N-acetylglucosamine 2-epimerase (non-hydrolysing)/GDP/UDP-N,N'-diacetylbacillosamine 2-epimerase (hydrolysing)
MQKKILVSTGARSEYGILKPLLKEIQKSKKLKLILVVTGSHLSKNHGYTINEIKKDGFKIDSIIKLSHFRDKNVDISTALGEYVINFSKIFQKFQPDINFIIGDRDEMFASAIAASHMNIINAHLAGGDKSGGVDEYNRHAITKLSNIHFANTANSKKRIIKMGEDPKYVFLTGSPVVDDIFAKKITEKPVLEKKIGKKITGNEILLIQHPVTTQPKQAEKQIASTLNAIVSLKIPTFAIRPNLDSEYKKIFKKLQTFSKKYKFIEVHSSFPRSDFLGLLKNCGILIGNSSSGIIEASCFSIPVINIGIRQKGRDGDKKVIEVNNFQQELIRKAILKAIKMKNDHKLHMKSIYGDGKSSKRITKLLEKRYPEKISQKFISY